jgi:Xaa-Pro aminopeptidase
MADELYPAARLTEAAAAAGRAGLGALLLTPGPDLRYVVGYDAHALERLTCLAVPASGSGDPFLVVPRLELPAAQASPAGRMGLSIIAWDETEDPYALTVSRLGEPESVGLADRR